MVLGQLAVNMCILQKKDVNWSILISLYQGQVQEDQGLLLKTRYTQSSRRKSGEEPGTHGHRGKSPEQNTNSLCSKIKNWQIGPHKITKFHVTFFESCLMRWYFAEADNEKEILLKQIFKRTHDVWKECKWNSTDSEWSSWRHWLTFQCFAGLRCSSFVATL